MYNYNDKIYFSLYANCSLIIYQPNRANLIRKNRSLKDTTNALLKGPKINLKKSETRGQKLSQLYHLQLDAAEACQSRLLELLDYCELTTKAETVVMNMNFRSILTRSLFGQTIH